MDDEIPETLTESDEFDGDQQEVAGLLVRERPVPAAGFRGVLARRLVAADPGYGPRPARLRLMVAGAAAAGSGAVGLGALVAAGIL
jgi:hypothetical protein